MVKTVLIADDHALSARGIADALEGFGGFDVVGIVGNGIDAIAMVKTKKPDCAVFDIAMSGANGLEAFLDARRWSPDTKFIILTGSDVPAMFRELVAAGIDGVFLKTSDPDEICAGIAAVADGARLIAPQVTAVIDGQNATDQGSLTPREVEVLHAVARGLSNAQIAQRLGLSPKTVDSHRTSLMRKFNVHSTATLLVRAMRDGLIDVDLA